MFGDIIVLSIFKKDNLVGIISPYVGVVAVSLSSLGYFGTNNYDPLVSDTFKTFYFSFLIVLSFSIILSENKNNSLYIPEGFAHGFCSLSDNTVMHYKCTNYRDEKSELGIIWNDPKLNIKWPIKKPIISKRDKKNLNLERLIDKL